MFCNCLLRSSSNEYTHGILDIILSDGLCSLATTQKKGDCTERDYLDLSKKTFSFSFAKCNKMFSIACPNEHNPHKLLFMNVIKGLSLSSLFCLGIHQDRFDMFSIACLNKYDLFFFFYTRSACANVADHSGDPLLGLQGNRRQLCLQEGSDLQSAGY